MIRILLNGKKAGLPEVRTAVTALRGQGYDIEVRVTWEQGDIKRLVEEAVSEEIPRIVAAGGDGTVNEVVNAIAHLDAVDRPEIAILPLGTANDFASACLIPTSPFDAIKLALEGTAIPVDLVKANDRHFMNVATGGFGAQITADTPVQLKNFIGGGAYTLSGIIKAINFTPLSGKLRTAESEDEYEVIVGAICNGRQAGGGQILAPTAFINDGLLDVLIVSTFPLRDVNVVIQELLNPVLDGKYIKRFKTKWVEAISGDGTQQVNLDGEPYYSEYFRFEVLPDAYNLILPSLCPCINQ